MSTEPTFNPAYRVARCGDSASHGPHVVEHGPDQPRNCPGPGREWRWEPDGNGGWTSAPRCCEPTCPDFGSWDFGEGTCPAEHADRLSPATWYARLGQQAVVTARRRRPPSTPRVRRDAVTSELSLSERIHALIFNGITKASSAAIDEGDWIRLSERERIARAVYAELRAGNIEFRLGSLALLADTVDQEARLAAKTPDDRIRELARRAVDARLDLTDAIREACPGPHSYTQHRDHQPAWCNTCGRGENGVVYRRADQHAAEEDR